MLVQCSGESFPVVRAEAEAGEKASLAGAESMCRVEQVLGDLFALDDGEMGIRQFHRPLKDGPRIIPEGLHAFEGAVFENRRMAEAKAEAEGSEPASGTFLSSAKRQATLPRSRRNANSNAAAPPIDSIADSKPCYLSLSLSPRSALAYEPEAEAETRAEAEEKASSRQR